MAATIPNRASLLPLVDEIFRLVARGATPDQWGKFLCVPLEHAAADGNLDLFNSLIAAGADGSAGYRGCHGRTLFDAAAAGGSVDVVSALIATGAQADINVVSASSRTSALYLATARGHEAAAVRLVRAGADVHFWDPVDDCAVLYRATCEMYPPSTNFENTRLVKELLIAGARPRTMDNRQYSICLWVAADSGLEGVVRAILASWAHIRVLDERRYAQETVLGKGVALVAAAENGDVPIVNTLLAAGAHPDFRYCDDTFTPLDVAARRGDLDVLRALIATRWVDLNTIHGENGCTPLHFAALSDQAGAIELLIEGGAYLEGTGDGVGTPLLTAAIECSISAMLTLLQHGADLGLQIVCRGRHTCTPLHAACRARREGLEAAVDLLLRWGADEAAADSDGRIPAEMLDIPQQAFLSPGETRCSQEEIDRVRVLLSPADRAWSRRGWLVMLRSRAAQGWVVSHESCETQAGRGAGWRAIRGPSAGPNNRCKVTLDEYAKGVDNDSYGKASVSQGVARTDARGEGWSDWVVSLLGLEVEGAFRSVVEFL